MPNTISTMEEARRRIKTAAVTSAMELDIGGLGLTELPEELYELSHLEVLYLGCPREQQKLHFRERAEYKVNCLRQLPPQLFISLPRLTHLYADANELSHLPEEIAALSGLTVLDLRVNRLGDSDLATLANLSNLTTIDLWHNHGVTDRGAEAVSRLTNLVSLTLSGNWVSSTGARALSRLTNLTSLDLGEACIGDEGAECLSALVNLTSLCVARNDISPKGVSALAGLSKLKSLDLWGNHLGAAGVGALKNLTNLETLNLYGAEIGQAGAKSLASLVNLTSLNVSENSLGAKGAASLAELTKLVSLNLEGNRVGPTGAQALAGLVNLEVLNLAGNRIGDEGLRALSGLTRLTKLDLRGNQITGLSAPLLAKFPKTVTVDLGNNPITKKAKIIPPAVVGAEVPKKYVELKNGIINGMIKYSARQYSKEDARGVGVVLQRYLEFVFSKPAPLEREAILAAIKDAVLALNELNDFCDRSLIETDEREAICDLILTAAATAGLQSDGDVTEEWREW